MKRIVGWIAIFDLLIIFASTAAATEEYKVVANQKCPVSWLNRAEASAMFMKKVVWWNDGTAVTPVDQKDGTARRRFSTDIHGRPVTAVKSYWQQQIFRGRDIPPAEMKSDEEVLAYIRTHPGAIGYVSDSVKTEGVKVLEVR